MFTVYNNYIIANILTAQLIGAVGYTYWISAEELDSSHECPDMTLYNLIVWVSKAVAFGNAE